MALFKPRRRVGVRGAQYGRPRRQVKALEGNAVTDNDFLCTAFNALKMCLRGSSLALRIVITNGRGVRTNAMSSPLFVGLRR